MSWRPLIVQSQIAAPGTGADVITAEHIKDKKFLAVADLKQPAEYEGWTWRINISCAAGSIVKLVDDTNDEIHLNGGVALTPNQNLIEDFIPDPARSYNLQLGTADGEIFHLVVLLVGGETV